MTDSREIVRQAYLGVLGREPDASGLDAFGQALDSKATTFDGVLRSLIESPEFKSKISGPKNSSTSGFLRSEAVDIFKSFENKIAGKDGYITNFMGGVTDIKFVKQLSTRSGDVETFPIPGNFHGDTLEWMGVLKSATESADAFTMIELGAGWAPWCVIGYLGAKRRGIKNINLVAVEGDSGHIEFIHQSFRDNGVPGKNARIVHGVVGLEDGTAMFPRAKNPESTYGAVAFGAERRSDIEEFSRIHSAVMDDFAETSCYSLRSLVGDHETIDLIHCDIQGSEKELFSHEISYITSCTKRIVVGTHSLEIDRHLVSVFGQAGWTLELSNNCIMEESPTGAYVRVDGTQVWRNSALK